jgi:hypothetical protein
MNTNCGDCNAADSWCWFFVVNEELEEGKCPCSSCLKNNDCDIVFPEEENNYTQCEKFHTAWPEED